MPRPQIPLHIADLSAFARRLAAAHAQAHQPEGPAPTETKANENAQDLNERSPRLSHVQWLNLLAKAAGHRNFQALRASAEVTKEEGPGDDTFDWGKPSFTEPKPDMAIPANSTLPDNIRKALAQFDRSGRLIRWPVKYSVQQHIMWMLWTRFDAKRAYTESEVNAILKDAHTYGDHATLRRELVNHRLLSRTSDCREYRKCARRPEPEVRLMLGLWRDQHRVDRGSHLSAPNQPGAPLDRAVATAAANRT